MNVFEGAKFGDKFRTRDGICALYVGKFESEVDGIFYHHLVLNCGFLYVREYYDNGLLSYRGEERNSDIVCRWYDIAQCSSAKDYIPKQYTLYVDGRKLEGMACNSSPYYDWKSIEEYREHCAYVEGYMNGFKAIKDYE